MTMHHNRSSFITNPNGLPFHREPEPYLAMNPAKILVIEDDQQIRRVLRSALSNSGYEVLEATNLQRAVATVNRERLDLILSDLDLSRQTGIEACSKIRFSFAGPIIVLSGRKSQRDKIIALDSGADDYIVKPFGMGELLARIRASLRGVGRGPRLPEIETLDLRVDLEKRSVEVRGSAVHLGPKEFEVLRLLIIQRGAPLTHTRILETIWGSELTAVENLRVVINQLRKKIEKDSAHPRYILTEHTRGYRFQLPTNFSPKHSRHKS
jgi:two-component system KDP operon response regulator KdpE